MLEFHPLANIFPLMEGVEFDDFAADIRAHGLHEPIVLYEGKILDGRNRYRACLEAGVEGRFETYEGDDPVGYVVSLNLRRRHLDESQRAMVAAKLATLRDGQRADLVEGLPIGRASELLNVSERSVARAREVQTQGAAELVKAVEAGKVSVAAAADVASLPKGEQQEIVARGEAEILQAARKIRAQRMEQRFAEEMELHRAISRNNTQLPNGRRYPILLCDPPWKFEVGNNVTGGARMPDNHYPCMPVDEICALRIQDLALDDAVLFLWTTAPHLMNASRVIEAWGFSYKTNMVWVKDRTGTGYRVLNQHEHLLIAARGELPCPPGSLRPPSVIYAPRREHSRKPDEAYEIIERMYPDLPKIELFARQARSGWAAWGNEAPPTADDYDSAKDVEGCFNEAYRAIRERKASGGKGWPPHCSTTPADVLGALSLVTKIELRIDEQGEAELARDRLCWLAGDDQLGCVLPRLFQLAVFGQFRHVFDGVANGVQRAAVGGRQRLGQLCGEIAGR